VFYEKHEQFMRALAASYIPMTALACANQPTLLCPACHDPYVHPVGVTVLPAGKTPGSMTITAKGLQLDPTVPPAGRGVVITLSFECEQGHAFAYELSFHKGWTFIRRRIGSGPRDSTADETIWRD